MRKAKGAHNVFRQAGYPVGSGAVESACKQVVKQPFKQTGMRWSRQIAHALPALRTTLLNQTWPQLLQRLGFS